MQQSTSTMLLKVIIAIASAIIAWLSYRVNDLISKRRKLAGLVSLALMQPWIGLIDPHEPNSRAAAPSPRSAVVRCDIDRSSHHIWQADIAIASTSNEKSVAWPLRDRRRMSQGLPKGHPFSCLGRLYSGEVEAAGDILRRLVGYAFGFLMVPIRSNNAYHVVAGAPSDHYS